MRIKPLFKRTAVCAAVAFAIGFNGAQAATVVHKNTQRFGVYNLVASFNGWTFGSVGNGRYKAMLCGSEQISGADLSGLPDCDADHAPFAGDEAAWLYPIDSEFGFNVVPYALASQKTLDGIYGEGFAGNIYDGDKVVGVELSDAATDTFQVPAGLGTWCSGLGGTSVKCSTEHYTVMEHVLTCHETVAYVETTDGTRADPLDGTQAVLDYVDDDGVPGSLDCATTQLDNDLVIHADGETWDGKTISQAVADMEPIDPADILTYLEANESTVLTDIAVGDDFSITAKDDGKPLYRWGTLIKRPNDIRLYVRHPLPDAFKTGGACEPLNGGLGCRITKAELHIVHNITNNPNDQVRAEDMENEGAIGRLPGYLVDPTYGAGSTVSDTDCYEGDGDFIPAGTVFKNADMALGGGDAIVGTDPYAWSEDLHEGLSNGWYTTVDREPFEWSYDSDGDGAADNSYRSPLKTVPLGWELLSGPRWRLTPGKFGQDLPGLDVFDAEVAGADCAPPPYQKNLIKYEVGEPIVTKLNLLDWENGEERSIEDPDTMEMVSPMTFSKGWVDGTFNEGTELQDPLPKIHNPTLTGVTLNGAPVSEDFDLSIYVKGDKKPTQLYYTWLYIEYDDGTPE